MLNRSAVPLGFVVGACLMSPMVQRALGYADTAEPLAEMIGGGLAAAALAWVAARWSARKR
jgi:hypothetical protein